MVFSGVLHATENVIESCGVRCTLPWAESMRDCVCSVTSSEPLRSISVHDATWMDDLCVFAAFPTAKDLISVWARISGQVLDSCLERGMMPNLHCNKSETLLSVGGAGSRAVRRDWLSEAEPRLRAHSAFWDDAWIRAVPSYRHLGGVVHPKADMVPEARSRAAQAWTAFLKHKRTVFGHSHVALADKVSLFATLVLSVLFHASATWCVMPMRAFGVLQRAYLNMARAMLAKHFHGDVLHLCEDRVLALVRLPSVEVWFHFNRLSYLASFVCSGVEAMWALAHAEGGWLALVRESLAWLWDHVGGARFVSWELAWESWLDCIRLRPRAWKRLLRFAKDSALRREVVREGWQQCRGLIFKRLVQAGGVVPGWSDMPDTSSHACGICQVVFRTKQAWSVHAFKCHGVVRKSRLLVDGEQCPHCLRHFASNIQLCRHVDNSATCYNFLRIRGFACVPVPGQGSRRAKTGANFLSTVRQGFGPHVESLACQGDDRTCAFADTPTWKALCSLLEDSAGPCTFPGLILCYRRALCLDCLSLDQLQELMDSWVVFLSKADLEALSVLGAALHARVAAWIQRNLSVEWLVPSHCSVPQHNHTFRMSQVGLAAMEFDAIDSGAAVADFSSESLVICPSKMCQAFARTLQYMAVPIIIGEATRDASWCSRVWTQVRERPGSLVVLCVAGASAAVPTVQGPLKAPLFRRILEDCTLVQDVCLLLLELVLQSVPVAAVIPRCDDCILASFKQLPGICWVQGSGKTFLYNIPEASIPEPLFHLLISCL